MNAESFNLDHTAVAAPFVRVADRKTLPGGDVLIKYDVRFTQPNVAHLASATVHSIEHITAELMRNHTDRLIDFSPMGCQTGFYALTLGLEYAEFTDILAATCADILEADAVPAANAKQCGWGAHHTIEGAKAAVRDFLSARATWDQVMRPEGEPEPAADVRPSHTWVEPERVGNVDTILLFAMDEEAAPLLDVASAGTHRLGHLVFHRLRTREGVHLAAVTGIGEVNAAAAAALAIGAFHPDTIVSVGTCGGLGESRVGDVLVGRTYRYCDADTATFGYEPGQIPGMPASYEAAPALLEAARALEGVRVADLVTSNSFISGRERADEVLATFPTAAGTDMESVALAQVAHLAGIDFAAVRCVSDLCAGSDGGAEFDANVDRSARGAVRVALTLLGLDDLETARAAAR